MLIYGAADVNVIPLVKNSYKTALPSKTATCFACQKPVIFAIGKNSQFGQKVFVETGCSFVESNDSNGLVYAIQNVKTHNQNSAIGTFYKAYFVKTVNSKVYSNIITSKR